MAQRRMQDVFALADLRLISAIGGAGTLTGAARLLVVDHSTAFRRLGALETRLGAQLFERARSGYTPTPAGEAALATAARILGELGDLRSEEHTSELQSLMRISYAVFCLKTK